MNIEVPHKVKNQCTENFPNNKMNRCKTSEW